MRNTLWWLRVRNNLHPALGEVENLDSTALEGL
jgi:hypothetical protein